MAARKQGLSPAGGNADAPENLCTISDLLKARDVTDALLSRLDGRPPNRRATMQLELAFLEKAGEAGRRIKGALGTDRSRARVAALVLLSRLIAQKLVARVGAGGRR